ncbi:MAG: GntR family transcriptional regulator [Planctomycetota bacterium]
MDVRPIDPHSRTSPSQQLVDQVLDALSRGELGADDRLPSVRSLAASALVNPNTVAKAYRQLEILGATCGRNGSGVYVTAGGVEIARRFRRTDTLLAFREAVLQALSAGHEGPSLEQLLRQLSAHSHRRGTKVRS